MKKKRVCETCVYWAQRQDNERLGFCWSADAVVSKAYIWPNSASQLGARLVTHHDHYCGEWELAKPGDVRDIYSHPWMR